MEKKKGLKIGTCVGHPGTATFFDRTRFPAKKCLSPCMLLHGREKESTLL